MGSERFTTAEERDDIRACCDSGEIFNSGIRLVERLLAERDALEACLLEVMGVMFVLSHPDKDRDLVAFTETRDLEALCKALGVEP